METTMTTTLSIPDFLTGVFAIGLLIGLIIWFWELMDTRPRKRRDINQQDKDDSLQTGWNNVPDPRIEAAKIAMRTGRMVVWSDERGFRYADTGEEVPVHAHSREEHGPGPDVCP